MKSTPFPSPPLPSPPTRFRPKHVYILHACGLEENSNPSRRNTPATPLLNTTRRSRRNISLFSSTSFARFSWRMECLLILLCKKRENSVCFPSYSPKRGVGRCTRDIHRRKHGISERKRVRRQQKQLTHTINS